MLQLAVHPADQEDREGEQQDRKGHLGYCDINIFLGTMERLKESPKNIEELHALRVYARDQLPEELKQISVKINKVMEKMTLTERMHYEISYDDFAKSWSIYGMPLKLLRRQDKCLKRLQNEEKGFQEDLMVQQGELHGEITVLQKELDILMMEHNLNQILEIAKKFTELGERIDRA
jgi:dynein heavy chain